jgi:zona occludens toxin (predicted ATPase)
VSIVAYTGLPGSGKSYSVVELQILPAMRAGRTVVTNIPLEMDAWDVLGLPGRVEYFETALIQAEPHKIQEFCRAGVIFILDECWRLWPQGMKADEIPEVYKAALAEHRHQVDSAGHATQIVLVTQDLRQIAAFARALVEETFVTTKLSAVGFSRGYRVDIYHGGRTGHNVTKNRLRFITGTYRKEIYKLYRSHTKSEAGALGGDETKMDTRANIFKRPAFIIGAVTFPFLLWGTLHIASSNFHGLAMKKGASAGDAGDSGRAQRSEHGSESPVGRFAAAPAFVSQPKLLFEVADIRHPQLSKAYLTDGDRVVVVFGLGVCRRGVARDECLYHGSYYDAYGLVEAESSAPVGSYSSAAAPPRGAGVSAAPVALVAHQVSGAERKLPLAAGLFGSR